MIEIWVGIIKDPKPLCVCGASFITNHAMIRCHSRLTFIHHNELRDLTASWLHEVCHVVSVEPPLQPLNGEAFVPTSANSRVVARADIRARVDDRVHFLILVHSNSRLFVIVIGKLI